MTREEALNKIGELVVYARTQGWDDEFTEAFETLSAEFCEDYAIVVDSTGRFVNATEVFREPCEDCISRQAELNGLASIAKAKAKSDAQKSLMGRVMFFTEHLPPVTPKQKTGWWLNVDDEEPIAYDCSECGTMVSRRYRFCPDCGAKMGEKSEKRNCNNCKYGYQSSVCQKPTAEICGNDFSQWMPCDAKGGETE